MFNGLRQRKAALSNESPRADPLRERRTDPRFDWFARILLSWREQGCDFQASGRLNDISQGGAATRDWAEAEMLGARHGAEASPGFRLKFLERWSAARVKTAVSVCPDRRPPRRARFLGSESLEDRQLMAAAVAAPVAVVVHIMGPVAPAQVVATTVVSSAATSSAVSFLGITADAFLATVLYSTPARMASEIAPDGAIGVNATWEAGRCPTWYIEEQRYGADFVQAGLQTNNPTLVQQGWQILDWGFDKEAANGSFPGTGDAFHSTSMFVEAAARALLLEVQSGAANAAQLEAEYLPRINASAEWLMTPSVAAVGNADDAPYTHRCYLLAAALGDVGELTGNAATIAAAEDYAEQGLAEQLPDGENPELGGGDSSYQMYGILLAERYLTVCPTSALQNEIEAMIVKGCQWEEGFINAAGHVSIVNSTRTGVENSVDGTMKTIDYKTIIQAFSVATTLTGDPSYRLVAEAVASGRGWKI